MRDTPQSRNRAGILMPIKEPLVQSREQNYLQQTTNLKLLNLQLAKIFKISPP